MSTVSRTFQLASPETTRVGFIGLGVMGKSMAGHILDAGYKLTVSNRTASKADDLVSRGASFAATPREVAEQSDVVFTIVGYPSDVDSVILDKDTGVLAGLKEGGIVCDMTTSKPSLAEQIATAAAARGVGALDAPVSGGDVGAREARLSVMCGGEQPVFDAVRPLLDVMGANIRHMGGAGAGQHTKMANQILIATNMVGCVEGLLYAQRAGLGAEEVIAAVGAGAAGSWSINNLGPRIARRDFEPGFYVEHFTKDMGIALEESERMGIDLPGLRLANGFYKKLQDSGRGRKGTQALMLVLEEMNAAKEEA